MTEPTDDDLSMADLADDPETRAAWERMTVAQRRWLRRVVFGLTQGLSEEQVKRLIGPMPPS